MRQLAQDSVQVSKEMLPAQRPGSMLPFLSQLQLQAIRRPEGNSHTGDVNHVPTDQLLTTSCAQQSPAQTILHKSKLNTQKLEQLPCGHAGEILCHPCMRRMALPHGGSDGLGWVTPFLCLPGDQGVFPAPDLGLQVQS